MTYECDQVTGTPQTEIAPPRVAIVDNIVHVHGQ